MALIIYHFAGHGPLCHPTPLRFWLFAAASAIGKLLYIGLPRGISDLRPHILGFQKSRGPPGGPRRLRECPRRALGSFPGPPDPSGPGSKNLKTYVFCRALLSAADGLGFRGLGFNDLIENRSFWGSGRPLGALEPSKKVGGFAPHLFKWF